MSLHGSKDFNISRPESPVRKKYKSLSTIHLNRLSDNDAVTSIGYIAYERNIRRSSVPTIRRSSSSPILVHNSTSELHSSCSSVEPFTDNELSNYFEAESDISNDSIFLTPVLNMPQRSNTDVQSGSAVLDNMRGDEVNLSSIDIQTEPEDPNILEFEEGAMESTLIVQQALDDSNTQLLAINDEKSSSCPNITLTDKENEAVVAGSGTSDSEDAGSSTSDSDDDDGSGTSDSDDQNVVSYEIAKSNTQPTVDQIPILDDLKSDSMSNKMQVDTLSDRQLIQNSFENEGNNQENLINFKICSIENELLNCDQSVVSDVVASAKLNDQNTSISKVQISTLSEPNSIKVENGEENLPGSMCPPILLQASIQFLCSSSIKSASVGFNYNLGFLSHSALHLIQLIRQGRPKTIW